MALKQWLDYLLNETEIHLRKSNLESLVASEKKHFFKA